MHNKLTVIETGLNPRIEMFRKNGRWYISLSFPRWVLNDLEHECGGQITLVEASSGIVGGSELTDDASLLLATKPPPPEQR